MNSAWDTDIAFRPETWKALAQHLLPGAFVMAFASSRGYHRVACALEDAGLILHPALGWLTGQGFPKSTRIPDDRFAAHRYGRQCLKPALEFLAVAQVPYTGKPAQCITQTGAGSLWVDGGRVGMQMDDDIYTKNPHTLNQQGPGFSQGGSGASYEVPAGRWPPNMALCHTTDCVPAGTRSMRGDKRQGGGSGGIWSCESNIPVSRGYAAPDGTETITAYHCVSECPVAALDQQAGERTSGKAAAGGHQRHQDKFRHTYSAFAGQTVEPTALYGDTGTASRFFFTADWSLDVAEQLAAASPVYYAAKASRRERDSGVAGRNSHCTVKPALTLCRWLATLLLPPAAYAPRRLLNPFAGSGSEAIGAMMAGWEEVVSIERDAATVAIAEQRLAYWRTQHQPDLWKA